MLAVSAGEESATKTDEQLSEKIISSPQLDKYLTFFPALLANGACFFCFLVISFRMQTCSLYILKVSHHIFPQNHIQVLHSTSTLHFGL